MTSNDFFAYKNRPVHLPCVIAVFRELLSYRVIRNNIVFWRKGTPHWYLGGGGGRGAYAPFTPSPPWPLGTGLGKQRHEMGSIKACVISPAECFQRFLNLIPESIVLLLTILLEGVHISQGQCLNLDLINKRYKVTLGKYNCIYSAWLITHVLPGPEFTKLINFQNFRFA